MQTPSETMVSPGRAKELADKADVGIERLSESAHQTLDEIADSAASATRQLGWQGERLISAQRRWARASYRTMSRHPLTAVAIAAVAGLLLGRLAEGRQRTGESAENARCRDY